MWTLTLYKHGFRDLCHHTYEIFGCLLAVVVWFSVRCIQTMSIWSQNLSVWHHVFVYLGISDSCTRENSSIMESGALSPLPPPVEYIAFDAPKPPPGKPPDILRCPCSLCGHRTLHFSGFFGLCLRCYCTTVCYPLFQRMQWVPVTSTFEKAGADQMYLTTLRQRATATKGECER